MLLGAVLAARCAPAPADPLAPIAAAYLELAAALSERDPRSASGDASLAPSEPHTPAPLSFSEIVSRAKAASDALHRVPSSPATDERRAWLSAQLGAVELRARQRDGETVSFSEELTRLYGLDPATVLTPPGEAPLPAGEPGERGAPRMQESPRDEVRRALEQMLTGTGSPAERLDAFETSATVPAPRLPAVFERALDECRRRTLARVDLPSHEHVSVRYVVGEPWSGFSAYMGGGVSTISVNTAYPLTVDRVLQLACHEGYPGHHVISVLRDSMRSARPELAAVPLLSPDAFATEAIATRAVGLVFTADERAAFERDVLFPLAGLQADDAERHVRVAVLVEQLGPSIAHALGRFLSGERGLVETAWALQTDALMQHPRATLDFASEYRGIALAYTGLAQPSTSPGGRWLRESGYPAGPVIMASNGHHPSAGSQGR